MKSRSPVPHPTSIMDLLEKPLRRIHKLQHGICCNKLHMWVLHVAERWWCQLNYLPCFLGGFHRAHHRCSQPDTPGTITSSLPATTRKQGSRDMRLIWGHSSISPGKEQVRRVTWVIHVHRCFDQLSFRMLTASKGNTGSENTVTGVTVQQLHLKRCLGHLQTLLRHSHPSAWQPSLGSADRKARTAVKSDMTNKKPLNAS